MNAPLRHDWLWLDIDIPVARDFIAYNEQALGRSLTHEESVLYVMAEFHFARSRAKQIVDTVKGEPE